MALTDLPALSPTTVGLDSPLRVAQRYLASAYDSVESLLKVSYPALRSQRDGSRGRLTDAEHDLFRAAVVFAGAGLDAVLKEALRSAIPIVLGRSDGAKEKYVDFVTRFVQASDGVDPRRLARLLVSDAPANELRESYIQSLTGSSLQSRSQVTSSLAALGLEGGSHKQLFRDAASLDSLFKARNEIAHEMDMTFNVAHGRGRRTRRERTLSDYVKMCHTGLDYAQRALNELEAALA